MQKKIMKYFNSEYILWKKMISQNSVSDIISVYLKMLLLFKNYLEHSQNFQIKVCRLNPFVEYNHFSTMINFRIIELLSDKGLESIMLPIL